MKILLLGEFSNVHWTLAEGLRALGHEVTVVSNGDLWKGFQADILLKRRSKRRIDSLSYLGRVLLTLPRLRGYDVVQFINPDFLELRTERLLAIYRYLRRHNGKLFLGAFGNDYYWTRACLDPARFRYSDFYLNGERRITPYTEQVIAEWIGSPKEHTNRLMAEDADGIVAGLYEYYASYAPEFPEKTVFIPFPIQRSVIASAVSAEVPAKVNFFLGIQRDRVDVKGAEVLERALDRIAARYPERCIASKAVSVPYEQYKEMIRSADLLLDQIYSYTPAMNALLGMARGLVVVGGGEEENYDILGERELRPIINVLPDEEDIYRKLEALALHPERLPELKRQSVEYIKRHHDYIKVAQEYVRFWQGKATAK